MTGFVLDNSVTMRWCFDKGSHPYADAVLHTLGNPQGLAYVPVLWRYEVSAVLSRSQKVNLIAAPKVDGFLLSLAVIPIVIDEDSAHRVLNDVHQTAITYGLTSYDAAYLELAVRRGLPLATLDAELVAACGKAGVAVYRP